MACQSVKQMCTNIYLHGGTVQQGQSMSLVQLDYQTWPPAPPLLDLAGPGLGAIGAAADSLLPMMRWRKYGSQADRAEKLPAACTAEQAALKEMEEGGSGAITVAVLC
jgi:hypothetical protein